MLLAVTGWLTLPVVASEESDYGEAVERARALTHIARLGDVPSAERAADALRAGTGSSQPEVLEDLSRRPYDLVDAEVRLERLSEALRTRPDTPDPERAKRELNRILALPRYHALHAGPSLLARAGAWLLEAAGRLLRHVPSKLPLIGLLPFGLFGRALQVIALAMLLGVLAFLLRAVWRRGRSDVVLRRSSSVRALPPDRFAEADGFAAAGDYLAAVRALAAGVAAALGSDHEWERSGLTVREIFTRAAGPELLRPLLLSFEAAAYAHRPPDAPTYARAAEAAAPFRRRAA